MTVNIKQVILKPFLLEHKIASTFHELYVSLDLTFETLLLDLMAKCTFLAAHASIT